MPAAAKTASAAPASAAANAANSGSASAPASRGPIKLGIIESLTGTNAVLGKDASDGFSLYLDSIGGAVSGRKIAPIFADDQGQTDVGINKAKQLVESDKVQLLMGLIGTPICYGVAQYIRQVHVPLLITTECVGDTLLTDSKYASPYLMRFSNTATSLYDPGADWAYKQGFRKAILIASDYGGGLETGDAFASAFIARGGSVVQELHPALGTADFGPFLAQLSNDADLMAVFLVGTDSLRFVQQYGNYAGSRKLQFLDQGTGMTSGYNLRQEGDLAVGFAGGYPYTEALTTPAAQVFQKAWAAKYPDRPASGQAVNGYASAQVLEGAIKKVNGNVEQKPQFLNALYATDIDSVKGHIHLDADHDIVQDVHVYKVVKKDNTVTHQIVQDYNQLSRTWDRTAEQIARLPWGQMKGKWPGMTKEQLAQLVGG